MDRISSSEFRRRYAGLTAWTEVTVNGRVIGTWGPIGAMPRRADPGTVPTGLTEEEIGDLYPYGVIAPFASQPHTPERKREIAQRHARCRICGAALALHAESRTDPSMLSRACPPWAPTR